MELLVDISLSLTRIKLSAGRLNGVQWLFLLSKKFCGILQTFFCKDHSKFFSEQEVTICLRWAGQLRLMLRFLVSWRPLRLEMPLWLVNVSQACTTLLLKLFQALQLSFHIFILSLLVSCDEWTLKWQLETICFYRKVACIISTRSSSVHWTDVLLPPLLGGSTRSFFLPVAKSNLLSDADTTQAACVGSLTSYCGEESLGRGDITCFFQNDQKMRVWRSWETTVIEFWVVGRNFRLDE